MISTNRFGGSLCKEVLGIPGWEKDELLFALKHGKITIVAHCQAWDIKNNCAQLEVGRNYEMKREEQGFDTLAIDDRHIVLAIERETLGPS